jgi:uncharacterized ion transporter superfamily protein YfcC
MNRAKQNPSKKEINQTCAAIKVDWSQAEQQDRRRSATTRQKWLLNVLLASSERAAVRVA